MDFELGANLFGRQGYAMPLIVRGSAGADGAIRTLATATVDENRYPNLWDLDLRLAKTFKFSAGSFAPRVVLSADLFNVFDSGTVLGRNRQLGSAAYRHPDGVEAGVRATVEAVR